MVENGNSCYGQQPQNTIKPQVNPAEPLTKPLTNRDL